MPSCAVSVWPASGVPVAVGATTLTGGAGATGTATAEETEAVPASLAPVTTARTTWPMSAVTRS